jgi:hypothetical protein
VIDRVRSFGLVVAIGFLLLVSLTVTAALAALSTWLFTMPPANALLWNIVNTLVSDPAVWRRVHARVGGAAWGEGEAGVVCGEGFGGGAAEVGIDRGQVTS